MRSVCFVYLFLLNSFFSVVGFAKAHDVSGHYLLEAAFSYSDGIDLYSSYLIELSSDGSANHLPLFAAGTGLVPAHAEIGTWRYRDGVLKIENMGKYFRSMTLYVDAENLEYDEVQSVGVGIPDIAAQFFLTKLSTIDFQLENRRIYSTISNKLMHPKNRPENVLNFWHPQVSFRLKSRVDFSNHAELLHALEDLLEIEMYILFPNEMTSKSTVNAITPGQKNYEPEKYSVHVVNDVLYIQLEGFFSEKRIRDCSKLEQNEYFDCNEKFATINEPYSIDFELTLPEHLKP